ncbi:hypothetical protein CAL7716_072280 [Calothrix sp. PCC 7716]|nr:hypothetical protein CAL7716_072280 [Calothrix sp. PCC 7716]
MGLGRVSIPSNSSFEQTARVLNDLVRKMPKATEAVKDAAKLRDGLTDVTKRVKQAKEAADKGSQLAKNAQQEINKLKNLGKDVKKAKDAIDNLKAGKWAKIGGRFASFMNLLTSALSIFGVVLGFGNLWLTSQVNESQIRQFELTGREFAIQFKLIQKSYSRLKNLEDGFKKLKGDLDATKKTLYGDVQNLLTNLPKVRKTANDALYEVRAGRKILEAKIVDAAKKGNDALYEVRAGRAKLEAQLATIKKQANDALFETRQGRVKIDANLQAQSTRLNTLATRVGSVESELKLIKPTTPNAPNQNNSDVVRKMDFPNLIRQNAQTINAVIEPYTVKTVDGKLESFRKGFDSKLNQKLDRDKLITEIQQKSGDILRIITPAINSTIAPVAASVKGLELAVPNLAQGVGNLAQNVGGLKADVNNLTRRVERQEIENSKQALDIETLKTRTREQEKVNAEGNKKLDDLLKWTLGISPALALIPRKTADLINPNIPNINQIGQAVRNNTPSTCRFSEAPIYAAAGQVNAHSTALDVVQTGLITANTGIVTNINNTANTINTKLGAQLTGGIGGFLTNFLARFNKVAEWLHLDRALNILIWWQTLHNGAMLSNNIFQTMVSGLNNVLAFIGIKDAEGNNLDIGSVVGKAYVDMLKTALGEQTYNNLNSTWNKANRTYQAVSNALSNITSMFNSVFGIFNIIGNRISKIANALRWFGTVADNAYTYMSETNNFGNPIIDNLTKASEAVGSFETVTSEVLNVKVQGEELLKNTDEIKKNINIFENSQEAKDVLEKSKNKEPEVGDDDV